MTEDFGDYPAMIVSGLLQRQATRPRGVRASLQTPKPSELETKKHHGSGTYTKPFVTLGCAQASHQASAGGKPQWVGRAEHINKLEMRAVLTSLRWRINKKHAIRSKFVHMIDSLVCYYSNHAPGESPSSHSA